MEKWKKLKEKYVYWGWRHMLRRRFAMPDHTEADYDIFADRDFVTVAAVTENKEFIMVRQFRPGPEQELISFPEGAIDDEESPEEAAARELLEETGYTAGRLVRLREIFHSYSTARQVCLLATGCQKKKSQQLDQHEFIEVFTLSPKKLRQLLRNKNEDQFHNIGCAYMALEYLGLL